MKKHWIKYAAIAVGLVILVLIAIPLFVNVNTFRPLIEQQLTTALNRKVTLGDLSLSIFSGSVTAKDLAIAGDPQFNETTFLTAKSLHIGVQLKPLLFNHQILIEDLAIDTPQIHLVHAANGQWNFSSLGRPPNPNAQPKDIPDFNVDKLSITNGHAVVESLPAAGAPLVYDAISLSVDQFSLKKQFPFTLAATLPAQGTLSLTGKAGPIDPHDAAHTTFDAQLTLRHIDPVAAGFLEPSAGISLLADIDAHAVSNGQTVTSNGTLHTQNLKLRSTATPAPKPIDITYTVAHNLATNSGQLQDAAFQTGKVVAHITGSYVLTPAPAHLNLKLVAQSLLIDDLQAILPAAGIRLPNGSVLRGGTLTTTLAVTGPITALTIDGPVQLDNTSLNGFNLGSQLKSVASAAAGNSGNLTNFQTIRLNFHLANENVTASNINVVMPAIGQATGNGTVAASGALNFNLNLKLSTTSGVGGTAVGILSALSATGGQVSSQIAANGIPVAVTGTTSNPIITPNVNSMIKNNAASVLGKSTGNQQVTDALGSLFGGKKKN
jgi:AsmA protein